MTFGSDLLYKQDEIELYGERGGEALNRLSEYVRKRAGLCEDYARGLQKLHRQFSPILPGEVGMKELMGVTDQLVSAHLELVEQVNKSLLEGLRVTIKEYEKGKKECLNLIKNERSDWRKTLNSFEKIKKAKNASIKAAEDARVSFEKANRDLNVTKAHVEKMREDYANKARKSLCCKEEYIQAARTIKSLQMKHYDVNLARLFDELQKIEINRINKTKLHLMEFGTLLASAFNEDSSAIKSMISRWEKINSKDVIDEFITSVSANSTSDFPFSYPEEIVIEDNCDAISVKSAHSTCTLSRSPSLEDASSINKRLEEIEMDRKRLGKERDGIKLLVQMYDRQPELADISAKLTAESQLNDLIEQFDKLEEEEQRLRLKLNNINNEADDEKSDRKSSVIWDEEEGEEETCVISGSQMSPLPGNPLSCLSKITISEEGTLTGKQRIKFKAAAIYDFDPSDVERELELRKGQVITILNDEGEWWHAEGANGKQGYVPFNYIKPL